MRDLKPRPMFEHEKCPQCQRFDTMTTIASYTTPMQNNTTRFTDVVECYDCGLRFYVGWTEVIAR